MEGDAQASRGEHGYVIRAITDCDYLIHCDAFVFGDGFHGFRLFGLIDDVADDAARELIVNDFELISVHVVDVEALRQTRCKPRESA